MVPTEFLLPTLSTEIEIVPSFHWRRALVGLLPPSLTHDAEISPSAIRELYLHIAIGDFRFYLIREAHIEGFDAGHENKSICFTLLIKKDGDVQRKQELLFRAT